MATNLVHFRLNPSVSISNICVVEQDFFLFIYTLEMYCTIYTFFVQRGVTTLITSPRIPHRQYLFHNYKELWSLLHIHAYSSICNIKSYLRTTIRSSICKDSFVSPSYNQKQEKSLKNLRR